MASVSAILLAAGYGTRLYPLTKDCPKALLPLGQGVVLDAVVDAVETVPGVSRIVLVTNHRFVGQFQAWQAKRGKAIDLVDDGTSTPETRLGAIRDLLLGAARVGRTDDLLVLGTDNLFTWSLADFAAFARTKRPATTIALRQVASIEEARRYGVVQVDPKGRVIRCTEKPAHPTSLTVASCVYYFPPAIRGALEAFVQYKGKVDAPGYFLEWVVGQEPVYGMMTTGAWFDIGSPESYQDVVKRWSGLASSVRPTSVD